jgi:mannose-6-phosphate isomerase-like protein (cupin superfamily)
MVTWFRLVLRGPTWIAAAVALAATLVSLRLAPAGPPRDAPVLYSARDAAAPDESANVTTVEVGRHRSASVHHLRVAEGVKAHVHREHEEQVVILSGEGRVRLGDSVEDVSAGSVVVIPRGTVHSLVVTGPPIEAVSVFSPPFDGKDRHFVE